MAQVAVQEVDQDPVQEAVRDQVQAVAVVREAVLGPGVVRDPVQEVVLAVVLVADQEAALDQGMPQAVGQAAAQVVLVGPEAVQEAVRAVAVVWEAGLVVVQAVVAVWEAEVGLGQEVALDRVLVVGREPAQVADLDLVVVQVVALDQDQVLEAG